MESVSGQGSGDGLRWTKRDDAIASMQQSRGTDNGDGGKRDNSDSINSHRAPWIVR